MEFGTAMLKKKLEEDSHKSVEEIRWQKRRGESGTHKVGNLRSRLFHRIVLLSRAGSLRDGSAENAKGQEEK